MLLFSIQPMFAKMVLPLLGGTPSVWNTCMFFFQAALLFGYGYAHLISRRLGVRGQAGVHLIVLAVACWLLPISIPSAWIPSTTGNPSFWLLGLLAVAVGGPFFAISATNPLLQNWFSHSSHRSAEDPYFLYAASNLGSMTALLGYPVFIEPLLRLQQQSLAWAWGYGLLCVLIVACAVLVRRNPRVAVESPESERPAPTPSPERDAQKRPVTNRRRMNWVLLSFVPSSWMLGLTTMVTTDIAAVPLLWVIPLALYLLTFVCAFARRKVIPYHWWLRLFVYSMIAIVLFSIYASIWPLMVLHVAAFFFGSMICHRDLAADRPSTSHLTEFYFWMSLGGMLGGLFNGLIAPLLFPCVLEYPVTLALACWLRPALILPDPEPDHTRAEIFMLIAFVSAVYILTRRTHLEMIDWGTTWIVTILVATPVLFVLYFMKKPRLFAAVIGTLFIVTIVFLSTRLTESLVIDRGMVFIWMVVVAMPLLFIFHFINRPRWFAAVIGTLFIVSPFINQSDEEQLYLGRSFFGVHRVLADKQGRNWLRHGTTIHGVQFRQPARQCQPLSYYHRNGPLGDVFRTFSGKQAKEHVALIGLGAGASACYQQPGQKLTIYEIDPLVVKLAENEEFFTYLSNCTKGDYDVVLGDARLKLSEAADGEYGLIVFDAFSSDAIPVHLLTREAIALYLSKLTDDGVLAFHISNKHLDLNRVVAELAADAGLVCRIKVDALVSNEEWNATGKTASTWAVLARRESDLLGLAKDPRWAAVAHSRPPRPWTDDFSNLVGIIRW
jgi:MFS family permease